MFLQAGDRQTNIFVETTSHALMSPFDHITPLCQTCVTTPVMLNAILYRTKCKHAEMFSSKHTDFYFVTWRASTCTLYMKKKYMTCSHAGKKYLAEVGVACEITYNKRRYYREACV